MRYARNAENEGGDKRGGIGDKRGDAIDTASAREKKICKVDGARGME